MRPDHDWPDLSNDDDMGNGYFAEETIAWDDVYERALVDSARRTSPVLGFPLRLDRAIQCHAHWDQV